MGNGNGHKKAETLCDEDIEKLFQSGEIGDYNPTTLLHTVWFFNTIYFGLRGVTEHHQMTWGDVKIVRDTSSGLEYLQMNERNKKTRTGKSLRDQRDIPQMAWANQENQLKCPVHAYKLYKSKRPLKYSNPTDPFYIQENSNREKTGLWYKSQPIGINKLGKFMKKMATAAGIIQSKEDDDNDESENDSGNRRLTNHSARRFMLQKFDDAGFEHNHIKQYTMGQCYGSDGKLTPFGAYGVETRSDDRIQPLVDCNEQMKKDVQNAMNGKHPGELTSLTYRTALAAGTFFIVKVKTEYSGYLLLKIFEPLPETKKPIKLWGVRVTKPI